MVFFIIWKFKIIKVDAQLMVKSTVQRILVTEHQSRQNTTIKIMNKDVSTFSLQASVVFHVYHQPISKMNIYVIVKDI